jgi:hypothetical protein
MTRPRAFPTACIISLSALLGAACGDDDSEVANLCESVARKLRGCGLIGEGSLECTLEESDRSAAGCQNECFQAAACSTLSAALCGVELADTPAVLALGECIAGCWNEFGFQCASPMGSTRGVDPSFVCDGDNDCGDSSDEVGCEPFACGDGQQVVAADFCDGFYDCTNGADENAGCEQLACADGSNVPLSFRCDSFADCADGSDEADCGSMASIQCGP